ncbi:uncharacterized protein [Malus domestica]|uniref:uncharacterized protein n=1 Tax=Malus domestica TaxID=3750 RepID=UPI0039750148
MTIITAKLVSVYRDDSLIAPPSHTQKTKLLFSIAFKIRHGKVFPGKSSHDSRENTQNQPHGSLDQAIHLHGVHRLRPRATFLRLIDARSLLWKRKGEVLQTRSSKVVEGVAEFVEGSEKLGLRLPPLNRFATHGDHHRFTEQEEIFFFFHFSLCKTQRRLPQLLHQVVLGEVCEGPMGQGGLRFRVAEIQGLPRRTFGR